MWCAYAGSTIAKITTNGTFVCGVCRGEEITSFVSPYSTTSNTVQGGVVILRLTQGQTVLPSINNGFISTVRLPYSSATIVSNTYSPVSGDCVIMNYYTYNGSSYTIGASDNRRLLYSNTGLSYWDSGDSPSFSISNRCFSGFYLYESSGVLPSTPSNVTTLGIRLR